MLPDWYSARVTDLDPSLGLTNLFEAERSVRKAHDALVALGPAKLVPAIRAATAAASKIDDEEEAGLQLARLAELLGEFDGPDAIDALVDVLSSDLPEARHAAGEELEALAFDRWKEVALGVERALERLPVGSPALPEIPYILKDVPEPGVLKLLKQFLQHEDVEAVAAALEVSAEIGDPAVRPAIEALLDDPREVDLGEGDDRIPLGELAAEAIELIDALHGPEDGEEEEPEPEPAPPAPPPRRGGRR